MFQLNDHTDAATWQEVWWNAMIEHNFYFCRSNLGSVHIKTSISILHGDAKGTWRVPVSKDRLIYLKHTEVLKCWSRDFNTFFRFYYIIIKVWETLKSSGLKDIQITNTKYRICFFMEGIKELPVEGCFIFLYWPSIDP